MSPALLLIAALGASPQAELLDFTASWCGPCQQMRPIVERLEHEGLPVRQVDVDQNPDLARRFNVTGIPAFVLVVNGQEVDRVVGGTTESRLRQMLSKIPSTTANPAAAPAKKGRGWFRELLSKESPQEVTPPEFAPSTEVRGQSPPEAPASATTPPPISATPPAAGKPLETAVRIRVTNDQGTDFGSGTLIGSRNGAALVLTCWHIFREFGETADVLVDTFPAGPQGQAQTFPGKLIKHDEKADVALVAITGCGVVPVSPIASSDHFPKPGDHVFSVGCGDGKSPSLEQHAVTRLNPYQGAGTTECTGMPIVGRSGGGLFDQSGRVIGVCFAADKADHRGVYVGTTEIHKLLTLANYGSLIPASQNLGSALADNTGVESTRNAPEADAPREADAPQNPFDVPDTIHVSGSTRSTPDSSNAAPRPPTSANEQSESARNSLNESSPEMSQAVETALANGTAMEATVILRPLGDTSAPSEVIVINQVSDRFRRYLKGEVDSKPVETSLYVPVTCTKLDRSRLVTADLMVDASAHTYVRSLASKQVETSAGVALLARVFDNRAVRDRR